MILEIKDLSFQFRKQPIFTAANLAITQPGIYAFVAPNGSGKTTLFNILTGSLRADAGQITLLGQPLNQSSVYTHVAYMQDISVLYPYLTAREHLQLIAQLQKVPAERVTAVADALQVTEFLDKKVRKYSLGMRQRLLVAMTFLVDAPLILLDEPLNGLDPVSLKTVRQAIIAAGEQGKTVIVSSHNLDEVDRITKDIIVIQNQQLHLTKLTDAESAEQLYTALFE
ncbi:ABC transporter ATP-binding protein [Schleiferilactobacillus harbinensis]|uniref:ABC transporter ATP-binding protein n=1 Tax=Schleiferilactobacillus harbinensis TaxID=304207 RepID=UPI00123BAC99|nr:ABC transporter ATP-binding protein [Schleiferilactobacillus harbinensis]QEU48676.1 ABC transporter ATP-binding protein [Schleiferilactobacillus harbinensis]